MIETQECKTEQNNSSPVLYLLIVLLALSSAAGWYFYSQSSNKLTGISQQNKSLENTIKEKTEKVYKLLDQQQELNHKKQITFENISKQVESLKHNEKSLNDQISSLLQNKTELSACTTQSNSLKKQVKICQQEGSEKHKKELELALQQVDLKEKKSKIAEEKINEYEQQAERSILELENANKNLLLKESHIAKLEAYSLQQQAEVEEKQKLLREQLDKFINEKDILQHKLNKHIEKLSQSNQMPAKTKILTKACRPNPVNKGIMTKRNISTINKVSDVTKDKQTEESSKNTSKNIEALKNLVKELQTEIKNKQVSLSQLQDNSTYINIANDLVFASGSFQITKSGAKILSRIASYLNIFPNRAIEITGHTDNLPLRRGESKFIVSNWELSAARAGSAIRYLQFRHKVKPQRLTLIGASQYHPINAKNTKQARQENRRIEIKLLAN